MAVSKVQVPTTEDMEAAILPYLAEGFVVANKTKTSVTLQKKKVFNVLWAVIGWLVCLLPGLIYMIVYASKPDVEIVEISVVG